MLTPRNVNAREFGHRFRIPADGDVYAQPLVLPRVRLADGHTRDLVFVATEHCGVDAWDADAPGERPIWHRSFVDAARGVTTIPFRELRCPLIRPEVGITASQAPGRTRRVHLRPRLTQLARAGGTDQTCVCSVLFGFLVLAHDRRRVLHFSSGSWRSTSRTTTERTVTFH